MFMFTKGNPKTTNIITEPCKYAGKNRSTTTHRKDAGGELTRLSTKGVVSESKIINNAFRYSIGKNEAYGGIVRRKHPAKFPILLVRDQILSWSNEGDTVLDIFSGSGTTCITALLTNRNYLGFEKNLEYMKSSEKYIDIVKDKINKRDELVIKFWEDINKITYKAFNK